MRLDTRNPAQRDLCKRVTVMLDGAERSDCVVADSDKGFVEIARGTRFVGLVKKPILARIEGRVVISLDGRNL